MTKKEAVKKTIKIEGWLSTHEAALLYILAKNIQADGEIVEIGSFKGKSTVALGLGAQEGMKKSRVYAIDPHRGILFAKGKRTDASYRDFLANIRKNNLEKEVIAVRKTSRTASTSWNKNIKLLFIDGLHDFQNAGNDYFCWEKFVVNGGVIAFHDSFCANQEVWKAVTEFFFNSPRLMDVGTTGSITYGVFGKPNGFNKLFAGYKIRLMKFCVRIHNVRLIPPSVKLQVIHHFFRIFLVHKYSLQVYLR